MNRKAHALVMLGLISLVGPIMEACVTGRIDYFGKAALIQSVLSAGAMYWWYHLDKVERQFRAGMLQNVGVLVLSVVALPIYFVRSRGWTKGGEAIVVALLFVVLLLVLSYVGEQVGSRVAVA